MPVSMMLSPALIIELSDFILSLGRASGLTEFAEQAFTGLKQFLSFDRGLAYFQDGNGKIRDQYLFHYPEQWSKVYLEYYSRMSGIGRVGNVIADLDKTEVYNQASMGVTDWTRKFSYDINHEFMRDLIEASGLKHSMHFRLFDTAGAPSILFAVDRLTDRPFKNSEIELVRFLVPHLNALNKKFYFGVMNPTGLSSRQELLMELGGLTNREREIVSQLCSGVSPANISKRLHITQATTHKHISHIYEKLRVSSLQELLVYLLNPNSPFNPPAPKL